MKNTKIYHEITSLSRTPGYPLREWYEEAKKEWICPSCFSVTKPFEPIDVHLAHPPENCSLNFILGVGVGYAQRSFLAQIGIGEGEENFLTGKVFDCLGLEITNLATFRSNKILFIRGDERSPSRFCDLCDSFLYHPMGKRHLYSKDVVENHVYESQLHQFIISNELLESVDKSNWTKIGRYKLPVL